MLISLASLTHYLSHYGYVALFIIVFVGGTYLPIPGGLIIIAAGALAKVGYFNIFYTYGIALAAGVTSDLLPFWITRRFEKRGYFKKYIEKHKYAKKIQTYMHTYPQSTIFLSRFVGFASMPVNILAGASRIRTRVFFSMDFLANIICTGIYVGAGYAVGDAVSEGAHITTLIGIVGGVMVAFYVAVFFVWRRMNG